jgi:hypothetical protein
MPHPAPHHPSFQILILNKRQPSLPTGGKPARGPSPTPKSLGFYDHRTEVELLKWLLAFNKASDSVVFYPNKVWLQILAHDNGASNSGLVLAVT